MSLETYLSKKLTLNQFSIQTQNLNILSYQLNDSSQSLHGFKQGIILTIKDEERTSFLIINSLYSYYPISNSKDASVIQNTKNLKDSFDSAIGLVDLSLVVSNTNLSTSYFLVVKSTLNIVRVIKFIFILQRFKQHTYFVCRLR